MPAFGTCTIEITGERLDGTPENKARLRLVAQGSGIIRDEAGNEIKFPAQFAKADGVAISLPYTITLFTDTATGEGASTTIGYEGYVATDYGRLTFAFGAPEAGSTTNLVDLTDSVVTPISDLQTFRDEAEAAAAAAAASATSVNREQSSGVAGLTAAGKLYEVRIPDRLTDASLSATIAAQAPGLQSFTRPRRAPASVLTQFNTGHGWDMGGTGWASKSIGDTADFMSGTQSFRWTTNGTAASAYVAKTGLGLDLTDKQVRIWFKVDDYANIGSLQLIAGNAGLSSYYWADMLSASGTAKFRLYKNGDWAHITFIPDMMNTSGTPTRSAIDTMRLFVQDNAGGALTVRVDRIEIIPEGTVYPTGVVSLCFDDSYGSAWTIGQPKLSQYGYLGTLFPVPGDIGTANKLTQAQLDMLANNLGWEVGAHATTGANHGTGLDGMTQAQRIAELTALRQWQQVHGYSSDSFAWPNGSWDVASIAEVRQFYATARLASRDHHETQYPPQPYRIKAINPTTQTLAQMQNEVTKAKAAATWCIFVFHDIVTAKAAANDVATADFNSLVDYINTQAVPVRTIGEVTKALA